ncbi:MAG: Ig-like domain repeat protein [Actinomycetota bacterium]|nr:Ig-like domain repeat protein [Actinomycetota bacterium]
MTVIANHFKSKGSCPPSGPDTDQGDGQSCWNAHRTEQANELASWIQSTVVPGAGDPDVAIVGDLNSYAGEDPIRALETAGYTNLPKAFHGDEAYSYVFDGQWGYLDYVMASSSLVPQVTGAGDVHNNADEPSVLDYNTDFKTAAQIASLYAPDRFRNSDHDPVLAGLDLYAPARISGTPPAGTVATPYSFAFTTAGTAPVTVSLASCSLPPGLSLASDGTVSGTPTAAGTYPFTVHAENPFGGADLATSITVDRAATTLALSSSANPSSSNQPVTFTATVSSPGGTTPAGTVRFWVDGVAIGGSVPLVGVSATSAPISSLAAGGHAITATYSGDTNFVSSDAALTQAVQYVIRISAPTPGARFNTGSTVPVKFTVTDVNGVKVDDATAAALIAAPCRLTVSATGVQTLASKCPTYDSSIDVFQYNWKTTKNGTGAVTVKVSLSYPGVAAVQVVSVPITLT